MGLYVLKYPYRRMLLPLSRALRWVHPDVLSYLATAVTLLVASSIIATRTIHGPRQTTEPGRGFPDSVMRCCFDTGN